MISAGIESLFPKEKKAMQKEKKWYEKDSTESEQKGLSDEAEKIFSTRAKKMLKDYRSYEYGVYKTLHGSVMTDDGLPTLKKSAFKMPGYRAVSSKQNLDLEF